MNNKEISVAQSINPNKTFTCFVVGETSLLIRCVEHLLQQGHIVQGIFSKDSEVNVWANQQGVTCFKNQQLWLATLQQQTFDYLFSIVNPWVIPAEILALPRKGAINYHDSPLPRYAGVNATVHALRNNEARHGISWHQITEGIDTGDILQQACFDILPDDTALSLNIRCYETAFSAFSELVQALTEETTTPIKQNLAERRYYGRWDRPQAACVLNWNDTAEQLDALIRALNMGSYRNTVGLPKCLIGNCLLMPLHSEVLATPSTQAPGTLLAITDTAIQIATGSQDLAIHQLLSIEGESLPAAEWVTSCNVEVGQVLPSLNAEQIEQLSQLDKRYCRHESYWIRQLSTVASVSLHPHRTRLASETHLPPYTSVHYSQAYDAVFLTLSFAVLLARLTQSYTFTLGFSTPALREEITGYEHYFAKQIPLNLQIEPQQTFSEILQSFQQQLDELHKKGTYLYDLILREHKLTAPDDLFSIAWVENTQDSLLQHRNENLFLIETTGICCHWPKTLDYLITHYQQLLNAIIQYPETPLYQLPLLDQKAIQQLQTWNQTQTDYPKNQTIVELFEQQVAKKPDNIALVFEEEQLSYRQLNEKANQLAHYLLTHPKLDNARNPLIAICVERSLERVIALLGILKAGGAYVPIDANYPPERIAYLLKDSRADIILTFGYLKAKLPLEQSEIICLDEADFANQPTHNPVSSGQAEDLAYVGYTSGSTGQPKGICIPQRAVVRLVKQTDYIEFSDKHTFLQLAPLAFDASTLELWGSLLNGGKLVVMPLQQASLSEIADVIQTHQITTLWLTAGLFHLMVDEHLEDLRGIKQLLAGGDVLSVDAVQKVRQYLPDCRLLNGYGPTENTTFTACCDLSKAQFNDSVPIGKPIANTRVYILDNSHQPMPIGIVGELCVAGDGLAQGYLKRPELTAEKFVEIEIFGKTERIYKTGDLARWQPDGNLEYLGRIDHQIKLRGFRIELGEIEVVLSQHEAVKEATVILHQADGNRRLVAYLTVTDNTLSIQAVRDWLKTRLPDYMVPAHFQLLDALPLTPNGKIDRKALEKRAAEDNWVLEAVDFVAPRTPEEELLADIWSDVLGVERIGIHDNFFELGGHSLLATQVISRIRNHLGVELPLHTLFNAPTLVQLSTQLLERQGQQQSRPPLVVQQRPEHLPLSFAQERLWFLDQLTPDNPFYNSPLALRIIGPLDLKVLQDSLNELQCRHETLRTTFTHQAGTAYVQINSRSESRVQIEPVDLSHLESSQQQLEQRIREAAHQPFDLTQELPLRVTLFKQQTDDHVLLLTLHHIATDGWSFGVLQRELGALYNAFVQAKPSPLTPLPIQYIDFTLWQRSWFTGETLAQQQQYWLDKLADAPTILALPADHKRPPMHTYRGAEVVHPFSAELTQQLKRLSRQHGTTLFMTTLAAFSLVMHRYTDQPNLVIGSPIANRHHQALESLIGFFVNTLALHIDLRDGPTFLELLQQVRQTTLDAYAHQDFPFERLVDVLKLERDMSRNPLVQVMFAVQNAPMEPLALSDMKITPVHFDTQAVHLDLEVHLWERNEALECQVLYYQDIFDRATIERMLAHFETLLKQIVQNANQPVSNYTLLTASEIQQLQTWNQTQIDYPQDKTVVALFEAQVLNNPDNLAMVFEGKQLSYQQLNAKANQLAHYLLTHPKLDNARNPLIAICVERSLERVIALLGILKAGGAYVPIDANYPTERIAYLLQDSHADIVLTLRHLTAKLPPDESEIICLEEANLASQSTQNPNPVSQPNDLAYVIYTSGSTGHPKGVMIEHQSLTHLIHWHVRAFSIDANDRATLFANPAFDASVWELWPYLATGACVYPGELTTLVSTEKLSDWFSQFRITVSFLPTPIIESGKWTKTSALADLRLLLTGGDALHQCPENLGCALINNYGPTENTVVATSTPVEPGSKPTIGKPIDNVSVFVLDTYNQLVPIGVPGELCIAGEGLARGYLNRPELTAEKFIEVALFGKRERIYKTGDLTRWQPDGHLEYLGRIDHQVKLRGFRIELGEIEAVLSQHEAIQEAAVILHQSDSKKRVLVAYLTVADNTLSTQAVRDWLKARLPDYMVPTYFQVVETLPLTPHGKIDRQSLEKRAASENWGLDTLDFVAPRTASEKQLATIWADILEIEPVGIHDNFFELGGDSILSIQMVARARQAGLQLATRDVFEYQTIAELANAARTEMAVEAEQGWVSGEVPLTPIQHWFFGTDFPEYWHFNQSVLLYAPKELSIEALQHAWQAVITQHDALRLCYQQIDGHWKQAFAPLPNPLPFSVEEFSQSLDIKAALLKRTAYYQTSLNLQQGPLTQLVVFKLPDSIRLFWCIHHLAVDGVSWRILQEDLHTAYAQAVKQQLIQLPAKTSSFKAWSQRLNNYASSETLQQELAYWQSLPTHSLQLDNPTGQNRLEQLETQWIEWDRATTQALLKMAPVAYNTQINDILLTALALTLHDWTQQQQCVINLESHGRIELFPDIDFSRTVGWFTSICPVALSLTKPNDLGANLKAIKEQLRAIPKQGIGYGLLTQLQQIKLPQGDILFNYLGVMDQGFEAGFFKAATEATAAPMSQQGSRDYLIEINGLVEHGQLRFSWCYSQDCYHRNTIKTLAEGYQQHLNALIQHCQSEVRGVTPSDFPLAGLEQATLDRVYAQYPQLQDLYPLTPMQQGMRFHALYQPGTAEYFEQLQLELTHLDPVAFKATWQYQQQRHPILRTTFLNDHNLQVVHAQVPFRWTEHDWRGDSEAVQQTKLAALLKAAREQGFNLSQAPLTRFDLIQLSAQKYVFIFHHHHILMDGWCLSIVLNEVRESYLALKNGQSPQLPSLPVYRHYIAWLQQQDQKAALSYWAERLRGFSAPTPIPILTHQQTASENEQVKYQLDANTTQQLRHFSQTHRLTLNTLIQGAWAMLLSRYSHESDLCFGVTVSGRHVPVSQIEQMVGLLINTLPLRLEVNASQNLVDWLHQIQTQHQHDNLYAYSPLFEIQKLSEVPNGTALFDSLLVFENYPLGKMFTQAPDAYQVTGLQAVEQTNYPLTLTVFAKEVVYFSFYYDAKRIDRSQIERLWSHLETVLQAIPHSAEQSLQSLPLMTEQEIQQLQLWNQTQSHYPTDQTLISLFEAQVLKTPDTIAVVFERKQLSYRQLNAKANQLAHYLLSHPKLDNVHNPLIAICVERSFSMVIAVLGILKAGGAYVPVDANYPTERIAYMLKQSAAPVLLTQTSLKATLPVADCSVIELEALHLADQPTQNPRGLQNQLDDLAYLIYTSGSTGQPKGVALPQRALVNLLQWQQQVSDLEPAAVTLQFTSLSFDVSFQEMFSTWLAGGQLVLVDDDTRRDAEALLSYLSEQQIERLFVPFVMLQQLAERFADNPSRGLVLKNIITAGEQLRITPAIRDLFSAWPECRLHNHYGPSETHVVTALTLPANNNLWSDLPSIGQPIHNNRIYLLDRQRQPVPLGVPGELCIAGDNLARGYLKRSELTAEKFIEVEVFGQRERLYTTGDLARWSLEGHLEYLGRIDNQIKLRGFRIELGEIEAVLSQHEAVKEAAVILHQAEGNQRLVAYLILTDKTLSTQILRDWLKTRLPDYMLPAHLQVIEALPLTPNGKIDRQALQKRAMADNLAIDTAGFVAPRTPEEELLANIWADVLNVEQVGIHDNFFELGGHSLLATQVVSRIRQSFQLELPVRELFNAPTIAELSVQLLEGQQDHNQPPIVAQPRPAQLPLSFAQERLWFLEQLMPDHPFYNSLLVLRLVGTLNKAALQNSLNELVRRHETLRTTFINQAGTASLQINPLPETGIPIEQVDLSHVAASEQQIEQRVSAAAHDPFDLTKEPPLRVSLFKLHANDQVLLLSIHHIATDGWSFGVLQRELGELYNAFVQNQPSPLAPLPIQYVDFTLWQRNWFTGDALEQQQQYWLAKLAQTPTVLDLPADHKRPPVHSYRGAEMTHQLSPEFTRQLKQFSRQQGTTLFMTTLAAFAIVISRYTGQTQFIIGSPIANRHHQALESLIGFFVNTLALPIDLRDDPSFLALLQQVRQTTLDAYAHQDFPFERLVETLKLERDMSRNPLVQVMFAMQNAPMEALALSDLTLKPVNFQAQAVRFDLEMHLWERDETLIWHVVYYQDLFEPATIERLLAHFQKVLEAVVADSSQPVHQYPLLTAPELEVLQSWNQTQTDYPKHQNIIGLFEEQVLKNPNQIAVVFEREQLTYQQLNQKANQLAHYLLSQPALQNQRNPLIAIAVERSLEMVIGVLGILKAGGAYVPIDPKYPASRIAYLLQDSAAPLLLTQSAFQSHCAVGDVVLLSLDSTDLSQQPIHNPPSTGQTEDLAYVGYTSGSTGQPKGVCIPHRAVVRLVKQTNYLDFSQAHTFLQLAPLAFDASTLELWGSLLNGHPLVVMPPGQTALNEIAQAIQTHHVTTLWLSAGLFHLMVDEHLEDLRRLKYLLAGGDVLSIDHVKQVLEQLPDCRLINGYGPTENTTFTACCDLSKAQFTDSVPIGQPIANTRVYLLDKHYQAVPIGVAGELYAAGEGLAQGYLNQPELTAEKFLDLEIFGQRERVYRTGDLARWRPDGHLEFLGRIDAQVKLRGFRIELGEIEAVLAQHSLVEQSIVTCTETAHTQDKHLCAYLVPAALGETAQGSELVADSSQAFITQWEQLYNETYEQRSPETDLTFNLSGWNSSYTGQPIPSAEMQVWLDSTVAAIQALKPSAVLEIGCGTGLLLSRIAPQTQAYWGTDFSPVVLQQVEQLKQQRAELGHLVLTPRTADDFSGISAEQFDTVVLNSVIQYFPSVDYLLKVLEQAIESIKPGGHLFVGDIRHFPLLRSYHASVQTYQASAQMTQTQLRQRVAQQQLNDKELVIDPQLFIALYQQHPRVSGVKIRPHRGLAQNELTRFRYQAILEIDHPASPAPVEIDWQDWEQESLTLAQLCQRLETQPKLLGLRGVPNARLENEKAILQWLENAPATETIAELRQHLADRQPIGLEPETLWHTGEKRGYDVEISWHRASFQGDYDVLFKRRDDQQAQQAQFPIPAINIKAWRDYANNPLHGQLSEKLIPQLRAYLSEQLPEYMIPATFVLLSAFPLTPNGKIDRQALPDPENAAQSGVVEYVAPRTPTEASIAQIWAEVLGLERVGIHDNFFELGGHSLLATQVVSRLRKTFEQQIEIRVRALFEAPTVAELAKWIGLAAEWLQDNTEQDENLEIFEI